MAAKKLTLNVDERVIAKARRYSTEHKTSISRLVTHFLDALPTESGPISPLVQRLMGVLPPDTSVAAYHKHLDEKHKQ